MWMKIFLVVAGISSGCAVSLALLAFVNAIGIYPSMATRTRTGAFLVFYENVAGLGLVAGSVFSVYQISYENLRWLVLVAGLSYGCFVGILIMGLAEVMDVFPIMFKRIKLKTGLAVIVLMAATGKLIGSLCYFIFRLWE